MDYQSTINWMFSQLPMYQRQGKTAFKKDLTNIIALCDHLDHPEMKFPTVHVAGTNGKGSTSHMIASVLQESGLKVGLYTSPHLKDFRERIRVNGICIDEKSVVEFIDKNKAFLEKQKVSFFEMTVALAFDYFAKQKVDIAVVEVGLGGRLDSTNILNPLVSVITNIGLDHTQFLGETYEEIAFEKAGIIKEGTPVVIGEKHKNTEKVFINTAKKHHADIYFAEDLIRKEYKTDLLGDYQKKNIKTAVQTLHLLKDKGFKISESDIEKGLQHVAENTGLKGRWQILQQHPKIICDTAHNYEGLSMVLDQLLKEKYEVLHIVLGVVNDKNLERILPLFPKQAIYYFCSPDIPRGMDVNELEHEAVKYGLKGEKYSSVAKALSAAQTNSGPDDLIYVGGSTFVVAELTI